MRWVFLAIPISLASLLVWSGIAGAINARALQSRGVRANGTIVGAKRTGGRVQRYNPVVEFTGVDGKSHRFEAFTGSEYTEAAIEQGKAVDVVYVADNPARAVVVGTEGSVPGSIMRVIVGLLLLGAIVTMTRSRESALAIAGSLRWVALAIVVLASAGFLTSGVVWGVKRYAFLGGAVRAEGSVVSHVPAARGGGFLAVFAFKSADGAQHQFAASELAAYKEGAPVEVVYKPDDPSSAVVHDFQQFWLGPSAMTLMGLFLAGLAALVWVVVKEEALENVLQRFTGS